MRKIAFLAVILAGLLLMGTLAACSGDETTTTTEATGTTTTTRINEVIMEALAYNPPEITVQAGEEVFWVNQDSVTHTVTGEGFDSGSILSGESYSRTFDTPGTYDYHCEIHPAMQGTVVVVE